MSIHLDCIGFSSESQELVYLFAHSSTSLLGSNLHSCYVILAASEIYTLAWEFFSLAPTENISAIVFDLGGVLLDWDPRYLYRKLFDGDEVAM